MKKGIFYRIANIASLLWLISIVAEVILLTYITRLLTHDPNFVVGSSDYLFLIPMLALFGIGIVSFFAMSLGGIVAYIKHQNGIKPLLGFSIKKNVLIVIIILFGVVSCMFGYRQGLQGGLQQATYTGQDVLNAINQYRAEHGLQPVVADDYICDDLVQRWLDITNPNNKYVGHAGFEKWVADQGIQQRYPVVDEVYATASTVQAAITFWDGSPGHRLAILGNYSNGCAYANNGTAVAVFGRK